MQLFLQLACLFAVGAVIGWCIELVFRRLFTAKKWINPGFLNGPYLPLYGFGTVILYEISDLPLAVGWKIVLFGVLLTAVEYAAGILFIKGMKIKLWDYSRRWGNIQGIICPLFSLLWTAAGTLFLFFVYPWLQDVLAWFAERALSPFFLGVFYGVFLVDLGASFGLGARLRKLAAEARETLAYEELKAYLRQRAKKLRKKVSFLLPFRSDRSLKENIRAFLDSRRHREGPVTAGGPDGEAPASPPEGPAPEDPGFEKIIPTAPERGEPVPQPESLPEDPAGESAKAAGRAERGGPALQPEGGPDPDAGGSLKDPIHGAKRGEAEATAPESSAPEDPDFE